jgi:hypothetical protein
MCSSYCGEDKRTVHAPALERVVTGSVDGVINDPGRVGAKTFA